MTHEQPRPREQRPLRQITSAATELPGFRYSRRVSVATAASWLACRSVIAQGGGLAPTHRLLAGGFTGFQLAAAVKAGRIVRVRHGWYALPSENADRLRAWRVGGRLTCSSGARDLGIWTTESTRLHVAVPPNSARLRSPDDPRRRRVEGDELRVHWDDLHGGTRFVVDPLRAVLDMARCEPIEHAVVAAGHTVRLGLISRRRWDRARESLPARARMALSHADPAFESPIEAITAFRLRMLGYRVRPQVAVARGIRVDLLLGARLVIELDGLHHAEPEQFRRDRARDARLSRWKSTRLNSSHLKLSRMPSSA